MQIRKLLLSTAALSTSLLFKTTIVAEAQTSLFANGALTRRMMNSLSEREEERKRERKHAKNIAETCVTSLTLCSPPSFFLLILTIALYAILIVKQQILT